jgi:hypothetical protein
VSPLDPLAFALWLLTTPAPEALTQQQRCVEEAELNPDLLAQYGNQSQLELALAFKEGEFAIGFDQGSGCFYVD